MPAPEPRWLTYTEAAARIRRSEKTIANYRRAGMPMGWTTRDGQRTRVVLEDALLAWFRRALMADPVRHNRRRAAARAAGLPEPARPAPPPPRPIDDEPESTVEPFKPALTTAKLLETMRLKRGADEYAALTAALRTTPTRCAGDGRFTAERLDPAELTAMAAMCADCPLVALCGAYAAAADPPGFWAGELRRQAHTVAA